MIDMYLQFFAVGKQRVLPSPRTLKVEQKLKSTVSMGPVVCYITLLKINNSGFEILDDATRLQISRELKTHVVSLGSFTVLLLWLAFQLR